MTEERTNAALEKLNRGVQDSRQKAQLQAMGLAQDYFDDSVEELKQRVDENRSVLKDLPDRVPGGREEAFQAMFQELMDSYSQIEICLDEARKNVSEMDKDQLRKQGEIEASEAARRQARELGLDLTQIQGTGAEGRIVIDDVKNAAESADQSTVQQAAGQAQGAAGQATDQAQQAAGQAQDAAGGAARQAQDTASQAQDAAGQVADQAQGAAGQVTDQAQQAAGQATDQAQDAAGQATDQAQQAAGQAQGAVGQTAAQAGQMADQSGGATGGEINATDAAIREARERGIDLSTVKGTGADGKIVIWDVTERPDENAEGGGFDPADKLKNQTSEAAGQATSQAQQAAGQAQDAAGGAAQQAQDTAGQAAGQATDQAGQAASQVAGQADGALGQVGGVTDQAVGAAQQTTDQAGQAAQGAGSNIASQGNGTQEGAEEPNATKAARRKAEEMGLDLSTVRGTGSGGLITIKDVVGS